MKKRLGLLMALILLFSLTACDGGAESTSTTVTTTSGKTTVTTDQTTTTVSVAAGQVHIDDLTPASVYVGWHDETAYSDIVLLKNRYTYDFFKVDGTQLQWLPRQDVVLTIGGQEVRFSWAKDGDRHMGSVLPSYDINTAGYKVYCPFGKRTTAILEIYTDPTSLEAANTFWIYDILTEKLVPMKTWEQDIGGKVYPRFSSDLTKAVVLQHTDDVYWYWNGTTGRSVTMNDLFKADDGSVCDTAFIVDDLVVAVFKNGEEQTVWTYHTENGEKRCLSENTVSVDPYSGYLSWYEDGCRKLMDIRTGETVSFNTAEETYVSVRNGYAVGETREKENNAYRTTGYILWDVNTGDQIKALTVGEDFTQTDHGNLGFVDDRSFVALRYDDSGNGELQIYNW